MLCISHGEQGACAFLRLLCFLLAVYQCGQLVSKDLLCLIELASFPLVHLIDLLKRQESQHTQAFEYVCICHVSPVLVEIERRSLVRIKPYGAALSLTHLLALGVEQQSDRHCVCIFAELAADQLGTAEHVAPLVISAELHVAAVFLVQCIEIVALHDHVVEFQEAQAAFHTLFVALCSQHAVYAEVCAYLAQYIDGIQVEQPVCIVYHQRLII